MTYADKIALARAGYSRAEIEAMDPGTAAAPATAQTATPVEPEQDPAAGQEQAQTAEPEQAPAPVTPAPVTPPQSLEMAMLQQILGAVQAGNRAGITGTTPPAAQSGMDVVKNATAQLMGGNFGGDK